MNAKDVMTRVFGMGDYILNSYLGDLADAVGQRHDLLPEVAHQAAVAALLRLETLALGLEEPTEPLERAQGRVTERTFELRVVSRGELVEDPEAEVLLALEIIVKRALRDTGR